MHRLIDGDGSLARVCLCETLGLPRYVAGAAFDPSFAQLEVVAWPNICPWTLLVVALVLILFQPQPTLVTMPCLIGISTTL